MTTLVGITLNDSDRRLLIALLVVALIIFLLLGCIGMLMRYVSGRMSRRMDYEIHDAVVYRVIQTPEQLSKYGRAKNRQLFWKQSSPAVLIALASLIFFLLYSGITSEWGANHWKNFSSLFYQFDWGNEDNYATVFGVTLLAKWPDTIATPTWVSSYWASYVLVPLWLISIVYYLVCVQGYIARAFLLNKRTHSIFEKNLDDFNFFDDVKKGEASNGTSPTQNNNQSH